MDVFLSRLIEEMRQAKINKETSRSGVGKCYVKG